MSRLSSTAERVELSGAREIVNLAMGHSDIVRLEIGEPDFPTPARIDDAAARSAATWSGYVQSAGTPQLREAAATSLARRHGLDIPPDRIVVCQGAAQGLARSATAAPSGPSLIAARVTRRSVRLNQPIRSLAVAFVGVVLARC